ncbi:LOW QUALITY PROTEIN: hypothetical protein PHMEG_00010974 [Phytophthora megakarya]|uniref:Uncharacterized protein n=1 Tax=Phytophthora megakarya TaxID=4795 RepID=A0A225WE23_9STRA|nr:LOW QUALITY PROTEIN: hypothetical protein PHMEG_00010974 [Phytophthora megakarya]
MPATIRDWYAQLPKSTRHNRKLLSTKVKKLYCRTTRSYAERYFTMKMRASETALQFFYRLNTAAVKAEVPFQPSSKRHELHLPRFVKKLKDVQLKTALEGHQVSLKWSVYSDVTKMCGEKMVTRHHRRGREMPEPTIYLAEASNLDDQATREC